MATASPRLGIELPDGTDVVSRQHFLDMLNPIDANAAELDEWRRPFYLRSVTYDAGNNRLVLTVGQGRIRIGGTLVQTTVDTTVYVNAPSTNTTYTLYAAASGGPFVTAVGTADVVNQVQLWQVATGAGLGTITTTDVRSQMSAAAGVLTSLENNQFLTAKTAAGVVKNAIGRNTSDQLVVGDATAVANTRFVGGAGVQFTFEINGSTVATITSTGLGIGMTPSNALDVTGNARISGTSTLTGQVVVGGASLVTALTVVETSASDPRGIMSAQYSSDANGARLHFRKARGTEASPTVVVSGDTLGRVRFSGYDGSSFLQMASIDVVATGTVASTRVPTYMSFSIATDAAPSVLTETMRILPGQVKAVGANFVSQYPSQNTTTWGTNVSNQGYIQNQGNAVAVLFTGSSVEIPTGNLQVDSGGLGIGTSPNGATRLTVLANGVQFALFTKVQATNDFGGYISFGGGAAGTTARAYIGMTRTGTGTATVITGEGADGLGLAGGSGIYLSGNGGAALHATLNASGNLGIGLAPSYTLDVNGIGRFAAGSAAAPTVIGVGAVTSGLYWGTNTVNIAVNGVAALSFDTGRNATFAGTTTVSAQLNVTGGSRIRSTDGTTNADIYAAAGLALFGAQTNHPLVFIVNDAEKARIDTSGNLIQTGGYYSIGATPAQQGTIRHANGFTVFARNNANSGDIEVLKKDTNDSIRIGGSGGGLGTAPLSVTLMNVAAGNGHEFGTNYAHFIGIGTTASAANAFLDGTNNNNLLRSTSSLRYKNVVGTMPAAEARALVLGLEPITYTSKAPADHPERVFVGLAAERVAEMDDRFVTFDRDGRPDWVQYASFVVPLAVVAKDHDARVDALERENDSLRRRLAAAGIA